MGTLVMVLHQFWLIPMNKNPQMGQNTKIYNNILARKLKYLEIDHKYIKLGVYLYLHLLEKPNIMSFLPFGLITSCAIQNKV